MKEITKGIWAVMLYDIVVLIGFIALARYFGHWWIALFGLLFINGYKSNESDCDTGKKADVEESKYEEAE